MKFSVSFDVNKNGLSSPVNFITISDPSNALIASKKYLALKAIWKLHVLSIFNGIISSTTLPISVDIDAQQKKHKNVGGLRPDPTHL